jgi:hypothetical protein
LKSSTVSACVRCAVACTVARTFLARCSVSRTSVAICASLCFRLITSLVSLYIVHEAHQLGAPKHLILRMIWNVAIDGVVGAAPLVGDVFDVLWRANKRNMALVRDHLGERGEFAQPITIPKV